MTRVKISREGTTAELFKAFIDDDELSFSDEEATAELEDGETYLLSWVVRGNPSSKYTIKIVSPDSLKFSHSDSLGEDKKDAGVKWIRL